MVVARYSDDNNVTDIAAVAISVSGVSLAGARCHLTDSVRTYTEVPLDPCGDGTASIRISSGYRSFRLNQAVGGAKDSNHLMGCAADLRCIGLEQALRYATILLDKFDEAHADFDEIAVERNLNIYWLHFAVRPKGNRRKVFLQVKR